MAEVQRCGSFSVEICHSRHDGGWFIQENREKAGKYQFRTSRKVYQSHADAQKAHQNGDVKWTKWS